MRNLVVFIEDLPKNTKTPVLTYCRKLVRKEEVKKGDKLSVFRKDKMVMYVDIYKAAELTVQEDKDVGPIFVKYIPYKGTSPSPID